jgi:[ribosomal protein S18]-alanine N-acetyltransferase
MDAPHIEAFVREALREPTFSLRSELERPFARLTLSREPNGDSAGLLVVWEVADELQILSVAVAPSARRRGHARVLVAEALDEARRSDKRIALLEVRRDNLAAIRLYRGFGFVALGLRRAYYADGEDAVEMALPLSAEGASILAERDAALERELEG